MSITKKQANTNGSDHSTASKYVDMELKLFAYEADFLGHSWRAGFPSNVNTIHTHSDTRASNSDNHKLLIAHPPRRPTMAQSRSPPYTRIHVHIIIFFTYGIYIFIYARLCMSNNYNCTWASSLGAQPGLSGVISARKRSTFKSF